ncbi:MAG: ATP-binding protein [Deltaproteobacteria bacterium]|nr:ATP-binding protein [Deltaproteobacteria bacterium]MBI2974816.1 ATP-binding protein [Deltaproteobacteria bacterium]
MSIITTGYIDREVAQLLNNTLNEGKIVVLLGPRQSGKTTLIKHILPQHKLVGYLTFDDLKLRQIIGDPNMGLKAAISRSIDINLDSPNLIIVLDECQKCPQVFEQVKLLYDSDGPKPRFLLTGSSSLELHSKSAESLAGRVRCLFLSPFSFSEYRNANSIPTEEGYKYIDHIVNQNLTEETGKEIFYKISKSKEIRMKLLDEMLIFGSFPECALYSDKSEKIKFLANFRNSYIEKDILDLSLIDDWKPYNHLLELLAEYNASTFIIKDMAKQAGISDKTLKKYLNILQKTLLAKLLPVYTKNIKRRLAKSPKLHFCDMGFVSHLTESFDLATLRSSGAIGKRLESFVFAEFLKASQNDWRPHSFSFWRTNSGYEIDLIYSLENALIPMEIKYSTEKPKLKSLMAFAEEQKGIKFKCVLYRGDYEYDKTTNTHFIPIWGL